MRYYHDKNKNNHKHNRFGSFDEWLHSQSSQDEISPTDDLSQQAKLYTLACLGMDDSKSFEEWLSQHKTQCKGDEGLIDESNQHHIENNINVMTDNVDIEPEECRCDKSYDDTDGSSVSNCPAQLLVDDKNATIVEEADNQSFLYDESVTMHIQETCASILPNNYVWDSQGKVVDDVSLESSISGLRAVSSTQSSNTCNEPYDNQNCADSLVDNKIDASKTYTVVFYRNKGRGGSNSVQVRYGEFLPEAHPPQREGRVFLGYFDEWGKQHYDSDMSPMCQWQKERSEILYAKWQDV